MNDSTQIWHRLSSANGFDWTLDRMTLYRTLTVHAQLICLTLRLHSFIFADSRTSCRTDAAYRIILLSVIAS